MTPEEIKALVREEIAEALRGERHRLAYLIRGASPWVGMTPSSEDAVLCEFAKDLAKGVERGD